ncbi:MAG: secondary thiamine-phosphate synthase enzyme YjbQ [Bacillota bacterium]|nr:secondary thiamine-phosphate synthase enzyme YjbQ [Bacillota bacterium]
MPWRSVEVVTHAREELVDVTAQVNRVVAESGIPDGVCHLWVPHTTAGVCVNEHADPAVAEDLLAHLARLVPRRGDYRHAEGNSDAHIKAVLVGSGVSIPVAGGRLALGTWQGVFFAEFDGPRRRRLQVCVVPAAP